VLDFRLIREDLAATSAVLNASGSVEGNDDVGLDASHNSVSIFEEANLNMLAS